MKHIHHIPARTAGRKAFTFLELMLVVAILGILVAIAAPRLVGKAKKAKMKATKVTMGGVTTALNLYEQDHGDFPTTEQGLQALVTRPSDVDEQTWEKRMDRMPLDAWGKEFQYTFPSEHGEDFDLVSGGPDGRIGTEDDITNYEKGGSSGK